MTASQPAVGDPLRLLGQRAVIFWDFDGVIKESVALKADAFEGLFLTFGREVATRVRRHHEAHGGMSRFEKLPLYLGWAGEAATPEAVDRYCAEFSRRVRDEVIAAPWVPGAREYLAANHHRQRFGLVSATPQEEMEDILQVLGIADWFRAVWGAPTRKSEALRATMARWSCDRTDALLVGDSESDYAAAQEAGVDFLLRRTSLNAALQRAHHGAQCDDFVGRPAEEHPV